MTPQHHDAWLVDLDGTLYAPRPVKLAMLGELAVGGWAAALTLRRFRGEHEALRQSQTEPVDSPYQLQVERTARAVGASTAEVETLVREWMVERPGKWLKRFARQRLMDEIAAFRTRGGRTALVSDYPARSKLRALGCEALFDVVVANGEANGPRWLKPHPDGYVRAAERLGVEAGRCLVLGDREDADGEAARRAEMSFRKVG